MDSSHHDLEKPTLKRESFKPASTMESSIWAKFSYINRFQWILPKNYVRETSDSFLNIWRNIYVFESVVCFLFTLFLVLERSKHFKGNEGGLWSKKRTTLNWFKPELQWNGVEKSISRSYHCSFIDATEVKCLLKELNKWDWKQMHVKLFTYFFFDI